MRFPIWPRRRDDDLESEIQSHLEMAVQERMAGGETRAQAQAAARREFGNAGLVKEVTREMWGWASLERLGQDLRYGLRQMVRNPGFTAVAVLSLALGIGANTAIFSAVHATLLRPLPYADPNRLIEITETNPLKHWTHTVASPANFADWRKMNHVFSDVAAYTGTGPRGAGNRDVFLTGDGEPQQLKSVAATGNLFDLLGVAPMMGRAFTWDETFEGKHDVVVLSYNLWKTTFAGDPHIIGRKIQLTGRNKEVIGVMPPGFFFPSRAIQLYVPLGMKPEVFTQMRRPHFLQVIARLAPGVSLPQAREEMTGIARRLEETYPFTNTQMGVRLDGFHFSLFEDSEPALLMLLGAAAFLLLIVCVNLANLQLGRAVARGREMAIRQALGAGRLRLIRQLLTESLALAAVGGALGLALAAVARSLLLRWAPDALPLHAAVALDSWVLAFHAGVSLLAPLVFGAMPALMLSRQDALSERSATGSVRSRSARDVLVTCEVALSLVLVIGAGLLLRSLFRLESVDPGFRPQRGLAFTVLFPGVRYPKEDQVVSAMQGTENRLRELPGVEAVGAAMALPLRGSAWTSDATPEGRPAGDYERELRFNVVTPDYFRAVGTPLRRGRALNEFDQKSSMPVTLVNEALARAYFPGEEAVGRKIKFGRPEDKDPWVTVVGVMADQKQDGMDARVLPEVYMPLTQAGANGGLQMSLAVRGNASLESLASAIPRAVHAVDKDLVPTDLMPLQDLVESSTGDQRLRTELLSGFALIALFLAALGIYGVLSYSVAQRSREIGIRMTLGASPTRLFGMVVGQGMMPVLLGSLAGLAGAYFVSDVIKGLLFGIQPLDPATYVLTTAGLAAVAAAACALPAWRAVRIDPLVTLRAE